MSLVIGFAMAIAVNGNDVNTDYAAFKSMQECTAANAQVVELVKQHPDQFRAVYTECVPLEKFQFVGKQTTF